MEPQNVDAQRHSTGTARSALWRIVSLAVALVAVGIVGYRLHWLDPERIAVLLERLRAGSNSLAAGATFVAIYALAISVGFPALPFTVAGGAIFGHLLGSSLSWIGAVAGSMLGYLIARTIGRESARRWLSRKVGAANLTESTTFFTLLRVRLVPVVPLSVVNFAAGLAKTHFWIFVAATAIGIVPVTVVFAYFADSLVLGLHGAKGDAYRSVAIACGALILLSLVPVLVRRVGGRG